MKLLVISDSHIIKTPDGKYWCNTAVHGYDFWKRYLNVFEEVHVVSRVNRVESVDEQSLIRADGNGVKIVDLPFVRGFSEYLKNLLSFAKKVKKAIGNEEVAVFRVPSLPAFIMLYYFKKLKRPYAFEVIADPFDCYAESKIVQKLFTFILKRECKKANGVSYVTKDFLQERYPCKALIDGESENHFTSYYSSINLSDDFFGEERHYDKIDNLRIVHVASAINSDVKGHTTLINVVEVLKEKGYNVHLNCLGTGNYVSFYEEMVTRKGLTEEITFLGLYSSKIYIKQLLMNSDIFVFPTKAEGLPRVLIEAMATGLPCLSTPVNGIPELIEKKYLFDPFDVEGFVSKIEQLINNPKELMDMSSNNLVKAREYQNDVLEARRNEFYQKLKKLAQ